MLFSSDLMESFYLKKTIFIFLYELFLIFPIKQFFISNTIKVMLRKNCQIMIIYFYPIFLILINEIFIRKTVIQAPFYIILFFRFLLDLVMRFDSHISSTTKLLDPYKNTLYCFVFMIVFDLVITCFLSIL